MLVAVDGPPLAITSVKVTVEPTSGVASSICLSSEMSMIGIIVMSSPVLEAGS